MRNITAAIEALLTKLSADQRYEVLLTLMAKNCLQAELSQKTIERVARKVRGLH